ncbi:MAG: PilZ domain-containing protein, partial [Myxococcota bacterium]
MAAGQKTVEKRRAPRIAADLLVKIEGIHEDYQRARGDISGNGVRLELSSAPGTPGDLELLHLATPDRERHVAIMGQIVRCLTIDSLGNEGSFVAVAFRFLPDRAKVRQSLLRLLRHVIRTNRKKQTLDIKHHIP